MGRLLKLREAHNTDAPSACSLLWGPDGGHLATCCASHTEVLVHDMSPPPPGRTGSGTVTAPVVLRHHKDGVTALALGPASGPLASASIDHSVKLCSFPGELPSLSGFLIDTSPCAKIYCSLSLSLSSDIVPNKSN